MRAYRRRAPLDDALEPVFAEALEDGPDCRATLQDSHQSDTPQLRPRSGPARSACASERRFQASRAKWAPIPVRCHRRRSCQRAMGVAFLPQFLALSFIDSGVSRSSNLAPASLGGCRRSLRTWDSVYSRPAQRRGARSGHDPPIADAGILQPFLWCAPRESLAPVPSPFHAACPVGNRRTPIAAAHPWRWTDRDFPIAMAPWS